MDHRPTDATRLRLVTADAASRRALQDSDVASARLFKPGLRAVVPSWLLSLVLHAVLFVVLAISLPGLRGGIVGDPDGDLRTVGIWVGHSGDGTGNDESGGGSGQEKEARGETKLVPAAKSDPLAIPATSAPSMPVQNTIPIAPAPVAPPVIGPGANPRHAGLFPRGAEPRSTAGKSGGDSAGGGRRGSRGSTPFFGIVDVGSRFVYVIDCSGSMYSHNAMGAAKSELLKSLRTLNRFQQFQIVFYNTDQKWLKAPGKVDFRFFAADEKSLRQAAAFVAEIDPDGGTQHRTAIELALRLHPDVIFFLTDGGVPGLGPFDLEELKRLNERHTRIHCVQFSSQDDPDAPAATDFLQKLAAQNDGAYVCRDVSHFDAPSAPRAAARSAGEEH